MIATVTNQGKTRWMIIDDAFDAEKLIEFLENEQIELFYLPSYSPPTQP